MLCGRESSLVLSAAGTGPDGETHLARVQVQRSPLAAQGTVLDVAGGGQSQEAKKAAGETGAGHGAGAESETHQK